MPPPRVSAEVYANTFSEMEWGLLYPPDESGGFSAPLKLPLFYNLLSTHGEMYLATISELFREELSRRFTNYLSRIALPEVS